MNDNTWNPFAMWFMFGAWAVVLFILIWSFRKLMKGDPSKDQSAPPGSGS